MLLVSSTAAPGRAAHPQEQESRLRALIDERVTAFLDRPTRLQGRLAGFPRREGSRAWWPQAAAGPMSGHVMRGLHGDPNGQMRLGRG